MINACRALVVDPRWPFDDWLDGEQTEIVNELIGDRRTVVGNKHVPYFFLLVLGRAIFLRADFVAAVFCRAALFESAPVTTTLFVSGWLGCSSLRLDHKAEPQKRIIGELAATQVDPASIDTIGGEQPFGDIVDRHRLSGGAAGHCGAERMETFH